MADVAPMIGSSVDTGIGGPPPGVGGGGVSVAPAPAVGGAAPASGTGLGYLSSLAGVGAGLSNLSTPSTAAEIYAMQQGAGKGTIGTLSSDVSAASMAGKLTGLTKADPNVVGGGAGAGVGGALGFLGGGLQVAQGLKQGGVLGYGGAVVGGLRAAQGAMTAADAAMGSSSLAGTAGTLGAAAGYIAAPLALYSAIKNWQQGNVKGDAIQGAEAGAAIGSLFGGIGAPVGFVIGGAVGAASSALGNPGAAEGKMGVGIDAAYNQAAAAGLGKAFSSSLSPAQNVQYLQSVMSAETNAAGKSTGLEQVFGRNNVAGFTSQMTQYVNSQIASGKASKNMTPDQLYSKVVLPWLQSKGATAGLTTGQKDVKGNTTGGAIQGAITGLLGQWQSGQLTQYTQVGTGGQTINVPGFAGASVTNPLAAANKAVQATAAKRQTE